MVQAMGSAKSAAPRRAAHLLEVENLQVQFGSHDRASYPVDGVSFYIDAGETLGIVGESGCGKSMTSLAILRLVPPPGRIASGRVALEGNDLLSLSTADMRRVRGKQISMILQDPMAALNPSLTVGDQVGEALLVHNGLRGKSRLNRVVELLRMVRLPAPEHRVANYPHQMSGGMRQRVAGAIGISTSPKVLICDEPTTALDVTIQAQYLDLLKELQKQTGVALVLITHDMSIVARMCNRVAVMYAGRIVETGPTREVFHHAAHPYTIALLRCLPRLEGVERLENIDGQPPDAQHFPAGCRFAPRCPKAQQLCHTTYPLESQAGLGHAVACHFPGDWSRDG